MAVVQINPFDPDRVLRWESCQYPERPPDKLTEFPLGCPACVMKLIVTISAPPPPGAFDGYWRNRDEIRRHLEAKGFAVAVPPMKPETKENRRE